MLCFKRENCFVWLMIVNVLDK